MIAVRNRISVCKHIALALLFFSCAFAKAHEIPMHTGEIAVIDPCAILIAPFQGETNVAVDATISWNAIAGAAGYQITLGTTPGGSDIIASGTSNGTTFTPPLGLPENSTIYITIAPISTEGQVGEACDEQFFSTGDVTTVPDCVILDFPSDGAIDVLPLTPTLRWSYAPRAINYRVIVRRTDTNALIIDQNVGNQLNLFIATALDPQTEYSVQITPFNENGPAVGCLVTTFTTGGATSPPTCSQLISPFDTETNVAVPPTLTWEFVPNADGYIVNVGTTPGGGEIIGGQVTINGVIINGTDFPGAGNISTNFSGDFDEFDTQIFVQITPYNTFGNATNCPITSFTTVRGCGPYVNSAGVVEDFRPQINLDPEYLFCENEGTLDLSYSDAFTEIIWSQLSANGTSLQEMSTSADVTITSVGTYFLEVSNVTVIDGTTQVCSNDLMFEVIASEAATIDNIAIVNVGMSSQITIEASGNGDYEYAFNNESSYQDSPTFSNVPVETFTVYVRDKNGCGVTSKTLERATGFPPYFTPNGDGINDLWQVRGREVDGDFVTDIEIYNRYGKVLSVISSTSQGWDGTWLGQPLPSSGYWYKANTESGRIFAGTFALRR